MTELRPVKRQIVRQEYNILIDRKWRGWNIAKKKIWKIVRISNVDRTMGCDRQKDYIRQEYRFLIDRRLRRGWNNP